MIWPRWERCDSCVECDDPELVCCQNGFPKAVFRAILCDSVRSPGSDNTSLLPHAPTLGNSQPEPHTREPRRRRPTWPRVEHLVRAGGIHALQHASPLARRQVPWNLHRHLGSGDSTRPDPPSKRPPHRKLGSSAATQGALVPCCHQGSRELVVRAQVPVAAIAAGTLHTRSMARARSPSARRRPSVLIVPRTPTPPPVVRLDGSVA